ncbi:MAG TPA: hypothetical protein VKF37_08645 [Chloroflexota bacterium]|nr:hypothetical protein [Chloroflexota bacterium]
MERLGALWQRNPNLALSYYQSISAAPKPPLQPHIPEQTGLWNQITMGLGNMVTQATNQPSPQMPSSVAPTGGAPIPLMFPIPGGKSGLHTVPAGLASQVAAAVTGGAGSGDSTHTVKIEVTVKDQRGNTLGHKVDTTRVIAGASTTLRPPYDRPKGPALDNPQPPGRWNEGW